MGVGALRSRLGVALASCKGCVCVCVFLVDQVHNWAGCGRCQLCVSPAWLVVCFHCVESVQADILLTSFWLGLAYRLSSL